MECPRMERHLISITEINGQPGHLYRVQPYNAGFHMFVKGLATAALHLRIAGVASISTRPLRNKPSKANELRYYLLIALICLA